jgi:serine/threonine protein kinase
MAFQQVLQGIHALHAAGFIHRDIKPSNLGIVSSSLDQINTVILDYGNCIRAATCDPKPGTVGTIPFLAPEMEATRYDQRVDIWACGIFGLCLFVTMGTWKWRNVVHARGEYELTLADLQAKPLSSIENLLSKMLVWDPAERISAEFSLEHYCFSSLPRTDQATARQSGQKRGRSESYLS